MLARRRRPRHGSPAQARARSFRAARRTVSAMRFARVSGFFAVLIQYRICFFAPGGNPSKWRRAEPVAEMALALMLAGLRNLQAYARADRWTGPVGTNLLGAPVTIFGGGGISDPAAASGAVRLRRDRRAQAPRARAGARVVGWESRLEAVRDAAVVVLALALTPETRALVDASFLSAMAPGAWLVNVARYAAGEPLLGVVDPSLGY